MKKIFTLLFLGSLIIKTIAQPNIDAMLKEGNILLGKKQYQDALAVFDKVIKVSPKNKSDYCYPLTPLALTGQ